MSKFVRMANEGDTIYCVDPKTMKTLFTSTMDTTLPLKRGTVFKNFDGKFKIIEGDYPIRVKQIG